MKIEKFENGIILKEVPHFNLYNSFENGQCFRWRKNTDNSYTGVANHQVLTVEMNDAGIIFYPTTIDDFRSTWIEYFDLASDYDLIYKDLSGRDVYIDEALHVADGLRLFHQDVWEIIISFIVSANNNIPRIKMIIEKLCKKFGTHLYGDFYDFPSPQQLAEATIEELRECGAGYRDQYLLKTARDIMMNPLDYQALKDATIEDAKKALVRYHGVGPKVAECIMLFSLGKQDVVPVDTWVKKIIKELYETEVKGFEDVHSFFQYKFGKYSGYAQQVLFHWARETKLGR